MAVEKARIPELIADVKKLIAVDLRGYGNVPDGSKRCLPPGYFNFRFTNPSKTLIGPGAGLAQPVHAEVRFLVGGGVLTIAFVWRVGAGAAAIRPTHPGVQGHGAPLLEPVPVPLPALNNAQLVFQITHLII
jgi:hypothetical protein